jgi:hypothetical protein
MTVEFERASVYSSEIISYDEIQSATFKYAAITNCFYSNLEIETAFGQKYLKFQASIEFEGSKVFASTACCEMDKE